MQNKLFLDKFLRQVDDVVMELLAESVLPVRIQPVCGRQVLNHGLCHEL